MNITLRRNKSDPDMIEIITGTPPFSSIGELRENVWAVVQFDFLEAEIGSLMAEHGEVQVTLELHKSELDGREGELR